MNDKERKKMIAERQAQQKTARVRSAALMVAEHLHGEDPDVKPLKKEVDDLRVKINSQRQELMQTQRSLGEALQKLAKSLEKHLPKGLF